MIPLWLAAVAFVCAAVPALLYVRNIRLYRPPPAPAGPLPPVSVLIPARNEEAGIAACVESVLASTGTTLECIVLDDHSTDATAAIVRKLAAGDLRVRLASAPPLPAGWSGKQHACFTLSTLAAHPVLVFLDADVRLAPDGLSKAVAFLSESDGPATSPLAPASGEWVRVRGKEVALVSGFARQETGTPLEKLLLPLIHFVLLGFLPLARMRTSTQPALGAGCGQLFVADAAAYRACGGHSHPLVRASFHDGVKLPRAFRCHGYLTDLFDATDVASCRMYRSAGQVWNGLAKNAGEGLGSPKSLPIFTLTLGLGQILPAILLVIHAAAYDPFAAKALAAGDGGLMAQLLLFAAAAAGFAVRFDAAARFQQSRLGAALHPLGVLLLLAIQWYALLRRLVGKPVGWKGRPAPA